MCADITARTVARPRPRPFAFVETYGSNMRRIKSGGIPGPVSENWNSTPLLPGLSGLADAKRSAFSSVIVNLRVETDTSPTRSPIASAAFLMRLKKTFHIWFGSASTAGSPGGRS